MKFAHPKILYLNHSWGGGGANQALRQLYDGLQSQFAASVLVERYSGTDPHICTFFPNSWGYRQYAKLLWWTAVASGSQYLTAKALPGHSFTSLASRQEYRHADLIHAHNLHGEWFDLSLLPRISREKPLVWTLQDMWAITGHCPHGVTCNRWRGMPCPPGCPHHFCSTPQIWDTQAYFLRHKKQIYSGLRVHLVAPSRWLAGQISHSILADKPVTVIHNAADHRLFRPQNKQLLRRRLGLPIDKFIILFAANFATKNPWKGGPYLQYLINSPLFPRALFLTLGELYPGRDSRHCRLGFISDRKLVADYFAAADVLLFPSIADTCPLTVIEALSCGTAVVGFSVGGVPELVTHRRDGYLAKYLDTDDLIAGLNYFYSRQDRLDSAAVFARAKVVKSFTVDLMVSRYLDLYSRLLFPRVYQ